MKTLGRIYTNVDVRVLIPKKNKALCCIKCKDKGFINYSGDNRSSINSVVPCDACCTHDAGFQKATLDDGEIRIEVCRECGKPKSEVVPNILKQSTSKEPVRGKVA